MERRCVFFMEVVLAAVLTPVHCWAQAIIGTSGDGNLAIVLPTPGANLPTPLQKPVTGLPSDASPHGVSYYGNDGALIADFGHPRIFVIKVSTATLLATIDTTAAGYYGYGTVAVAPKLDYALAAGSSDAGSLLVVSAPFDASSQMFTVTLPGSVKSYQTQAIVFHPDGQAFVYHTTGISVLNPPYNAVAYTIPIPEEKAGRAVAITPDGSQLLATTLPGEVWIYTAPFTSQSVPATAAVSGATRLDGIMVAPDGAHALLCDSASPHIYSMAAPFGSSSVINEFNLPVSISAGRGFEDIGISADSQLAIITGNSDNGAATPAAFIRAPFTQAAASVMAITINGGRGAGAVRFMPPGLAPGLTIQASAPSSVASGATLTYTFEYGNSGTTPISDVMIKSVVPTGTSFISATGGGSLDGNSVNWTIGPLVAGQTGSVSMTVRVDWGMGVVKNAGYTIQGQNVAPIPGPLVSSSIQAWLLPSSARVAGAGGTFWTTDVTVSNTGTVDASLTLKFLGNNIDGRYGQERSYAIGAGKTVSFPDVLASVFGLSSAFGAIRMNSTSAEMIVLAQTSTPGAGGTYGQSVPATSSEDLIVYQESRSISAVREDSRFRTNLVLANMAETPIDVDVALVSEAGVVLGSGRYSVSPVGMTQLTQIVRKFVAAGDVSGARLVLSTPTPGGLFAAYASIIDNVTGDPRTLLPMEGLTWLLPSSARAGGASVGTFWTTDLTVSNIGDVDGTLTLKFLGNNQDGRSGQEKTYSLGARKSVAFADVLSSVFGLSSGFGAIRLSSSISTLTMLGQTSTPGGGGGTYGQSVPAATQSDLIREGSSRSIIALRQDAAFRTNLVLANATESGLDVDVTLIAESGTVVGSKRYSLYPLGMTQVSQVVRDLGASGNVSNGRLVLSTPTSGGAFAAYAPIIDNKTGDPRTVLPR